MDELEIFTEALQLADQTQRKAYLDRVCAADAALRQRVERLLSLHDQGGLVFDRQPQELLKVLYEQTIATDAVSATTASSEQLTPFLTDSERPGALGRLGRYDVLEYLGQGGFGVVVKAFDNNLHRIVAIKVLAPHLAATSPPRKRFLREARATAQVKHENVVQVYAVEEQPTPFLVTEFVEGQTLQQQLEATGPMEAAEVARLGRQIALGLRAAHEKGLVHRDVKPANILIEARPEPIAKLTDFGLARAVDDASLTQSGVIAGSPMFMSPEQARGEALDHRSDLFSLGSVLYTMVTGRPPFRAANALAVMKRVSEDAPRPIRQVIADVPEGLCAVIERLLEKKPGNRFNSAHEAADALAVCLTAPPRRRWAPRWAALAGTAGLLLVAVIVWVGGGKNRFSAPGVQERQATPTQVNPSVAVDPWKAAIALMEPEEQVTAVVAELKKRNPNFDPNTVTHAIVEDTVRGLDLGNSNWLTDLSPLRALTGLEELDLGIGPKGPSDLRPLSGLRLRKFSAISCPITDLSPLQGMPLNTLKVWQFHGDNNSLRALSGMPLTHLNCGGSMIDDLTPLRGLPLEFLCVNHTPVEALTPLHGMPLKVLVIENCKVQDLTPVAGLPLEELYTDGSPITDFTPIRKLPLRKINLTDPTAYAALLRAIPTLETINGKPSAEWWNDER